MPNTPALSPDEAARVEHAQNIPQAAHQGQVDKAGLPYFESHVADVHRRVVSYGGDVNEQIAALLHDVLEDTDVSESDLRSRGVPEAALVIVKLLTKVPDEPKTDYLSASANTSRPVGSSCSVTSHSNTDPDRLALLTDDTRIKLTRKYGEATRHLANATSHN